MVESVFDDGGFVRRKHFAGAAFADALNVGVAHIRQGMDSGVLKHTLNRNHNPEIDR